jgi:hypothetical protein
LKITLSRRELELCLDRNVVGVGDAPLEVHGAAGQQVGLMVAVVLLPSAELSSILLVDDALDCVEDARADSSIVHVRSAVDAW